MLPYPKPVIIEPYYDKPEWINKRDKEIASTIKDRMKQWIMK